MMFLVPQVEKEPRCRLVTVIVAPTLNVHLNGHFNATWWPEMLPAALDYLK